MAKTTSPKTKSVTTKRPTAKKSTPKKTARSATKAAAQQPFLEFRITQQTLYWLIFGAAAITFTMWLYTLDARVRDLYDQLDVNSYSLHTVTTPPAGSIEEAQQ